MEYVWKENKRFILTVGGAALFFLIYHWQVLGGLDASAERFRMERTNQEASLVQLTAQGVPEEGVVQRAKADAERMKQSLADLREGIRFELPQKYVSEAGGLKKHFDSMRIRVYDELKQQSTQAQFTVPERIGFSGLPERFDDAAAEELLLRLAMVERLWKLIIDNAGAEGGKIVKFEPLYQADPDFGKGKKKAVFLSKVSVRVEFISDSKCVFATLHGLQKRGGYLAVEIFRTERKDETKDEFKAEMVLSILKVDDKAPLQEKVDSW